MFTVCTSPQIFCDTYLFLPFFPVFIISSKTMFGQDYNWIIRRLTIFAICSIKIKPDTSKRAFLNTVRISVYSAKYTYKKKMVMLRNEWVGKS